MSPMPTVTYDGKTYKVKSWKIEIPDLVNMSRTEALFWICRNTYPRGHHKKPNPLAGLAGAGITVEAYWHG